MRNSCTELTGRRSACRPLAESPCRYSYLYIIPSEVQAPGSIVGVLLVYSYLFPGGGRGRIPQSVHSGSTVSGV